MAFCSFSRDFTLQKSTDIENVFIFEYMPDASGEAVKVYLYGLYLCQASPSSFGIKDFSASLKLSEEDVKACFVFWEECGLTEIVSEEPFEVRYLPVSQSFSKHRKFKAEKYTAFTKSLQQLLPGRMISTNEYNEYFNVMETFNIKPEAMIMIVKYCADLKGDNISYRYITAVAKDFAIRGIVTVEGVEKELSDYFKLSADIAEVLKALGSRKKPEMEDLTAYSKWLELGFERSDIVFAASKIKKGGVKQLSSVIEELYSNKKFSREEISEYLKEKEKMKELAVSVNRALSVYTEVLEPVVNNYVGPWLAKGYDGATLVFIANYCFKHNKRTLEEMDEAVNRLYSKGLISPESIKEYIAENLKEDGVLKQILKAAGVSRKPNEWDRENYRTWKYKWNFADELILYAAELSAGKGSPVPYINAVLSSWKSKEIYSLEQAKAAPAKQAEKNRAKTFSGQRNYSEEELDALIDNIDEIEL